VDFNWFLLLLAILFSPIWIPLTIAIVFYSFFVISLVVCYILGMLVFIIKALLGYEI
jgi:hypothetical protein